RNYKGKVVLINFWATWCPPCRNEIPDLIKFRNENRKKFEIIGIALDREGPEIVKKFAREIGINYPVIMGTPEIVSSYGGIQAIPTSFLVDKEGDLVKKIVGFRNYKQFKQMINPFLED
ncbi:MAG: TlpA family protein disulfide reductase, partial [Bacteroidetes bacterium]